MLPFVLTVTVKRCEIKGKKGKEKRQDEFHSLSWSRWKCTQRRLWHESEPKQKLLGGCKWHCSHCSSFLLMHVNVKWCYPLYGLFRLDPKGFRAGRDSQGMFILEIACNSLQENVDLFPKRACCSSHVFATAQSEFSKIKQAYQVFNESAVKLTSGPVNILF